MDRPVSVFVRGGSYSVCSSVAVICHSVSREHALLAIGDHIPGATVAEINQWLNQPSDAAEFRATWASAVSGTLEFLTEQVAALPTSPVVDAIADQLAATTDSVAQLQVELQWEQQRAAELQARQRSERLDAEWEARKAAKKAKAEKSMERFRKRNAERRKKVWGE